MGPQVWDDLVEQLQMPLEPGFRLVVQPLPGYTPEQRPVVHYSVTQLLDDLMADLEPPVILCGWSLGAILAMFAASKYPEQIKKLILIGATPNFIKRTDWANGIAINMIDKMGSGIRVDPAATLKRFITIFNQNDVNAREITKKLSEVTSAPVPSLESGLDLLKHTDLRPIVPNIRQPTLLIHGAHDTLMPLAAAEWLNRHIQKSQLVVFPDASHAPFLSDPGKSAQVIADFLDVRT